MKQLIIALCLITTSVFGSINVAERADIIRADATSLMEAFDFAQKQTLRLNQEYPDAAISSNVFRYSSGRIEITIHVMRDSTETIK